VPIKNDNFARVLQFCKEFGFQAFSTRLSDLRESGDFKEKAVRLSALEERMDRPAALVGRVAVSSAAETVTGRVEADVRILKEAVGASAAALEERMQQCGRNSCEHKGSRRKCRRCDWRPKL
jgi:hypothetical protein